jgi:hypothetical protein
MTDGHGELISMKNRSASTIPFASSVVSADQTSDLGFYLKGDQPNLSSNRVASQLAIDGKRRPRMIKKNAMAKTSTKKKPMTLDDLAAAIQQDFLAIRKDMATKDDMRTIRADMVTREDIFKIREEMATKEDLASVSDRISVAKDELQAQIAGLRYAKEIDALRAGVNFLERKLGIGQSRRAA